MRLLSAITLFISIVLLGVPAFASAYYQPYMGNCCGQYQYYGQYQPYQYYYQQPYSYNYNYNYYPYQNYNYSYGYQSNYSYNYVCPAGYHLLGNQCCPDNTYYNNSYYGYGYSYPYYYGY